MSSTHQPHTAPPPPAPIARLGRWFFVPGQESADGEVCAGYLSCRDERIVLSYSSGLLADFVRRIQQLQDGFAVRFGSPQATADVAPLPASTPVRADPAKPQTAHCPEKPHA